MDSDNDKTIGRTNVSGGGVSHLLASAVEDDDDDDDYDYDQVEAAATTSLTAASAAIAPDASSSSTLPVGKNTLTSATNKDKAVRTQPPPPPPPPPPQFSRARTANSIYSPGGTFVWPTSAEYYQLTSRIGQGAFATVWGGSIKQQRGRKSSAIARKGEEAGAAAAGAAGGDNCNPEGSAAGGSNNNSGQQQQVVVECAIKIMDLEHVNININDLRLEVQTMRLSSHPNILVCHASFVRDTDLWLVTQLMSKGSSLRCLQGARAKLLMEASLTAASAGAKHNNDHHNRNDNNSSSNDTIPPPPPTTTFTYTSDDAVLEGGLTIHSSILSPSLLVFESHITYILYETLLGLKYIHDNGQIHRDIKAGNILLDGCAYVRIADFGVSSWLIDGGNRREHTTTFVGTPCWMAPEVMEQVEGYEYRADIWSLGITALELCKGYAPYAKYAPMKVLLLTIQEDPPSLHTYNDGDDVNGLWSESFRSMIAWCLQKDPSKRPTCAELLAHPHFMPLANADVRAVEWRERTKREVCDVVEDVEKLGSVGSVVGGVGGGVVDAVAAAAAAPGGGGGGGDGTRVVEDSGRLLAVGGGGDAAAAAATTTSIPIAMNSKRDRPAGTSWIFPSDSTSSSAIATSTTTAAAAAAAAVMEEDAASFSSLDGRRKDQDFFDQFEEQTGGENFDRDNMLVVEKPVAQDEDNTDNNNAADDGPSKNEEKEEEEEDDINDFFDQFEEQTGGENFRRHASERDDCR
ncbi:hypothetical protein ACHAWU_002939 [Discostella pseudostelligera]|uniref:Protein kinase domain-containing protein n=1 Tax=Discostella pseudostelligera TaxID=259834 RepID=A0ABD3LZA6_9STRA